MHSCCSTIIFSSLRAEWITPNARRCQKIPLYRERQRKKKEREEHNANPSIKRGAAAATQALDGKSTIRVENLSG